MNLNFISKIIFIFLFFSKLNLSAKPNPFSKIEISSNSATVCKDSKIKNLFNFTYQENVLVKFADDSTAKAQELEVKLNTDKNTQVNKEVKDNLSLIEKITFKKNVVVQNENKTICADMAVIFPKSKICKFVGNVEIKQTKINPKDIPITTKCVQAKLNLITEEIIFSGSENIPVSTTISIDGYPELMNPIKNKK
ncbi:hypothetical protein KJ644_04790 [Candidatus Dependentiae bacterium]|nr:hypothetical protein [Candidatus Dependentiae bacterium]MBU4387751.1 hypothetical protein [Candidatus Dependentiae bacterium]MCG2756343.1 hypothetical protein [Candidatus Dependentiae bacterium]